MHHARHQAPGIPWPCQAVRCRRALQPPHKQPAPPDWRCLQAADKAQEALPEPPQTGTASASAKKAEGETQSKSNPLDALKKAAPDSLPTPAKAAQSVSLPNPAEAAKKAVPSTPSLPNPVDAAKKAAPQSDFGFDFGGLFGSSSPQDAAKKADSKVLLAAPRLTCSSEAAAA